MRHLASRGLLALTIALAGVVVTGAGPADGFGGRTTRENVSSSGQEAAGPTSGFAIGGNGRYVLFGSSAPNLVPGDTAGLGDIFLRDRWARTTRRISTSATGAQAEQDCYLPALSADGRFAAFLSPDGNLVPGDTNGYVDIFLCDLRAGTIRRLDLAAPGGRVTEDIFNMGLSADGRYVTVSTVSPLVPADTNDEYDVYVHEPATGITSLVSRPSGTSQLSNGYSYWQSVSATGRYVAFASDATNLVPGDTNGVLDIFVRDRQTATTVRAGLSDADQQLTRNSVAPSISADGRYVTFSSEDGAVVPGDPNSWSDVFLRDLRRGTTTMVSVTPDGVAGNDSSSGTGMTPDGRYVVFGSWATDLVAGDANGWYDVFLRDLRTGRTELISVSTSGAQGWFGGENGAVTADGRHVGFSSSSFDLVPNDTNNDTDIFVRDR